jgi:hypothetical protein
MSIESLNPSQTMTTESTLELQNKSTPTTDTTAIELKYGCIDLLCKMECFVAEFNEAEPVDRHEVAEELSRKIIDDLKVFSSAFFSDETFNDLTAEIEKVSTEADALKELIDNRSFAGMVRLTFGGSEPNEDLFKEASKNLFKAVKRSVVTLMFHAIKDVGAKSPLGEQLDQSTRLFVAELESVYREDE